MLYRISLFVALAAPPALAQSAQENADRFARFINSTTYTALVVNRALATDRAMAPPCAPPRDLVGRRIVAVTAAPQFAAGRDVPVSGSWVERVSLRRCGALAEHNVFVSATRQRGVHAVAGFPGDSRTDLDLQAEIGKAVLERARAGAPGCNRFDVVRMEVTEKPASRQAGWAEQWTVWQCGRSRAFPIQFSPKPQGGVTYTIGG